MLFRSLLSTPFSKNRNIFCSRGCLFALFHWRTCKWVYILYQTNLVIHDIFLQLILNALLYCPLVLSRTFQPYPRSSLATGMRFPYSYAKFACRSNMIRLLLHFKYPCTVSYSCVVEFCWNCHKQMDMIWVAFCIYDFYPFPFT